MTKGRASWNRTTGFAEILGLRASPRMEMCSLASVEVPRKSRPPGN